MRRFVRWLLGPYRCFAWRVDDLVDAAQVELMNRALAWSRAWL